MSLATRCPVCATAFRVQRAQLAARSGRVRCGKCGTVFDGIQGLVEEGTERLNLEPSPQLGLFDPRRATRNKGEADSVEAEALPPFLEDAPGPSMRQVVLWSLLALLAGLALAGQVAYRYRTEIAILAPGAKSALVAACHALRCQLSLPRRPELMSIDSSDLQADSRRDNVIVLNAVIRNRAPFPQDYPALELTLTDEADRPVLRRVLQPREYLDAARAPALAQGMAPASEASVRVFFDAGRARATGYRLYLFYPQ
ncbi:MAG TPA: DUF3426 domain-containing protein [Burkholderiales bacterium]|nr:DUF3426 domain-containing protein [Burkholderiales bacterium]